jgi:hypothetical protein
LNPVITIGGGDDNGRPLVDADHQRAAAVKPRPHQRLIDLALDEEPVLKILDGLSALAAHLPRSPLPGGVVRRQSTRRLRHPVAAIHVLKHVLLKQSRW